MIKEVIVVEGKSDINAVKAAIQAEVIAIGGFGYKKELVETLKQIANRRGIIIFTDPDYAGENIRKDLSNHIKNAKHAFLPQGKAIKKEDIGVENASREDIIEAIMKARPVSIEKYEEFSREEILELGLFGGHRAKQKRGEIGDILGIGYSNSKQFVNRLNNFGITRKEFERALRKVGLKNGK